MDFLYFLAGPLSWIIKPIYSWTTNYGITLILATIVIKLITIPLTLKSQKNMSKTQLIQPEINKIQAKYKNDREKLAIEMQKLYKQYDVNPMGGCLPLLLQMFVLFGFIGVIYHPFEYILGISEGQLGEISKALFDGKVLQETSMWGNPDVVQKVAEAAKGSIKGINFDFFGIDLAKIPSAAPKEWTVWIFPVLATASTFLSSYITKKQQPQQKPVSNQGEQVPNTGNMMLKIMPFMTAFFTYTMPIGMSLYWTVSTVTQLIQQAVMNRFITDKIKGQIEEKQAIIIENKEKRHPKKH